MRDEDFVRARPVVHVEPPPEELVAGYRRVIGQAIQEGAGPMTDVFHPTTSTTPDIRGGDVTPLHAPDRGAVLRDTMPPDDESVITLEHFAPVLRKLSAPGRAHMLEAVAADIEAGWSATGNRAIARVLRIIAAKEKGK